MISGVNTPKLTFILGFITNNERSLRSEINFDVPLYVRSALSFTGYMHALFWNLIKELVVSNLL